MGFDPSAVRLLIAALGAGTGGLLFLIFANRILSRLRGRHVKPFVLLGALIFLVGGSAGLGYGLGYPRGLALALAGLVGVISGEMYLNWQRWRARGDPPVEVWRSPGSPEGWRATLARPLTTTDLVIPRYMVRVATRPGGINAPGNGRDPGARNEAAGQRLRIAHLSDLHVNSHLPRAYYEQIIERVGQYQPDLVFITGDFVTHAEDVAVLPGLLRQIRSRAGVYGVLGNHDHWIGARTIAPILEQAGIEWIGNGWRRIEAGGRALLLAGCEAPWNRQGMEPLPGRRPDELLLVLSHTADPVFFYSQAGAAAMFSGHYHAGQFRLPYLGALIVPSQHGRRFDHGHFEVGLTHLFVSAGVGCAAPAFRLYCPPDFYIVDFEAN